MRKEEGKKKDRGKDHLKTLSVSNFIEFDNGIHIKFDIFGMDVDRCAFV